MKSQDPIIWRLTIVFSVFLIGLNGCATAPGSASNPGVDPAQSLPQWSSVESRRTVELGPGTAGESPVKENVRRPTLIQPLTLEHALQLARSFNPDLLAKREERGIADGELQQASIFFQHNPELGFGLGNRFVSSESEYFVEPGVELSQEFEIGGQPQERRGAAEAARDAVFADIETAEWETLARVRREFYAVQVASRRVKFIEEQLKFTRSVLELATRQFDAGEIARTDFRQVEVQAISLQTRLLTTRAELQTALNELRLSLGVGPDQRLEVSDKLEPPTELPVTPRGYVTRVLETHPRLRHARLIVEQRRRQLALVKKEAIPNITGGFFWEKEERDAHVFGAELSMPLPVFNRNQGSIVAASSGVDAAEAQGASLNRSLESRAKTAVQHYTLSYEAASLSQTKILPGIRANLALLQNAYRQGEISLLDLRVNQREIIDAELTALDTLDEYFRWRSEIEGLVGENLSALKLGGKTKKGP